MSARRRLGDWDPPLPSGYVRRRACERRGRGVVRRPSAERGNAMRARRLDRGISRYPYAIGYWLIGGDYFNVMGVMAWPRLRRFMRRIYLKSLSGENVDYVRVFWCIATKLMVTHTQVNSSYPHQLVLSYPRKIEVRDSTGVKSELFYGYKLLLVIRFCTTRVDVCST